MSADLVGIRSASDTLVADTPTVVNLTSGHKPFFEVAHHNDAPEVLFVLAATSENGLGAREDMDVMLAEWDVVLPGERVLIETKRGPMWAALVSAGAPSFTIAAVKVTEK